MNSGATDQSLLPFFVLRHRDVAASAPVRAMGATDEELLLRLESGDLSAVDHLFDRYAVVIFRIGIRMLHDRGEAEDLVQDVFLHLCQKARGFDAGCGSARTWIIQIAYRRAFDRHTFLCRRKFYDGTDLELLANSVVGSSADAMENILAADELSAAFEDLTENQRLTLEMFFVEGLDFREIGARLGETVGNTRHFYYRGLEQLRRTIATLSPRNGK